MKDSIACELASGNPTKASLVALAARLREIKSPYAEQVASLAGQRMPKRLRHIQGNRLYALVKTQHG